jgi:uncharacterized protein
VRARIAVFVAVVQSILFLGHAAIYETWIDLWGAPRASVLLWLWVALAVLSVSFVAASILAFRWSNPFVRTFYRITAGWLGFLNFFLCGSCLSWIAYELACAVGWRTRGRPIVVTFFVLAVLVSVYGIFNAARIRVKRIAVELANLPESWRGRTAALVSDTHLGHVRNCGFSRRIVRMLSAVGPDIVFIAGDLYDGTRADLNRLAEPWSRLSAPLGTYFVAGNHEEFSDPAKYIDAVRGARIRVLNNEKVIVDGMQLVGVDYRASRRPRHFESILRDAALDPNRASILLSHAPHQLPIAERAGVSLQLSGHTHRGQMIPFRWVVERIFGPYAYGLHRFGQMIVYTSSGAGTWGPPLRVGTDPEMVLIRFE